MGSIHPELSGMMKRTAEREPPPFVGGFLVPPSTNLDSSRMSKGRHIVDGWEKMKVLWDRDLYLTALSDRKHGA